MIDLILIVQHYYSINQANVNAFEDFGQLYLIVMPHEPLDQSVLFKCHIATPLELSDQ